ncbi:MAG: hypothetical protein IT462_04235 [Planctomycetes bacterium]|nr:hypothetical protein [Planctomycetota bacterium]
MYSQIIKVQVAPGQEREAELSLKKYLKAARLNPGYIHGSYFMPDAHPGGDVPPGFEIENRETTFFVYLAFRSPKDMLKHVEMYHGDDLNLLPTPHDYVLGKYVEDDSVDVENRYES